VARFLEAMTARYSQNKQRKHDQYFCRDRHLILFFVVALDLGGFPVSKKVIFLIFFVLGAGILVVTIAKPCIIVLRINLWTPSFHQII